MTYMVNRVNVFTGAKYKGGSAEGVGGGAGGTGKGSRGRNGGEAIQMPCILRTARYIPRVGEVEVPPQARVSGSGVYAAGIHLN